MHKRKIYSTQLMFNFKVNEVLPSQAHKYEPKQLINIKIQ